MSIYWLLFVGFFLTAALSAGTITVPGSWIFLICSGVREGGNVRLGPGKMGKLT